MVSATNTVELCIIHNHTKHTHTHTYIYIYIYVCVCVRARVWVGERERTLANSPLYLCMYTGIHILSYPRSLRPYICVCIPAYRYWVLLELYAPIFVCIYQHTCIEYCSISTPLCLCMYTGIEYCSTSTPIKRLWSVAIIRCKQP